LSACALLPTNDQLAPPTTQQFADLAPAPAGSANPLEQDTAQDVVPPVKFEPKLSFDVASLKAGDEPSVTINIYQTKNELEVRKTETFIENAGFRFDKLALDAVIGSGKMEIGTPPKLTGDVTLKVLSTDAKQMALLSVKAASPLMSVYIADLYLQQTPSGLSIVSLANATRADDKNGVSTTPASVRIIQTFAPGYLKLPATAGSMRARTIISSEPDPASQVIGQRVFRQTFVVEELPSRKQ
jgi:hypothetical protein